jgi:hypothetical protein
MPSFFMSASKRAQHQHALLVARLHRRFQVFVEAVFQSHGFLCEDDVYSPLACRVRFCHAAREHKMIER